MTKRYTHFFAGSLVWVLLILHASSGAADAQPSPLTNDALKHAIWLAKTTLVEVSSPIDDNFYLLVIQMQKDKPNNRPAVIHISVGSRDYLVPAALFNVYGVAATTYLYQDGSTVAFVLFCGDGEHAKHYVFRVNPKSMSIRREDWSPLEGKLRSVTPWQRMRRAAKDVG